MKAPSSKYDICSYLVLDGLSIECTPSGNEVYFTPDIDIHKNFSMSSATSSIYAETGARAINHLNTFSAEEEEEEENVLMSFSICSTNEEEDVEERGHDVVKETIADIDADNADKDVLERTESNYLPGRYQRPRDSFERSKNILNEPVITNQPQPQPQMGKQQSSRPILNVITSLVPPTKTGFSKNQTNSDQWTDENRRTHNIAITCDPRSPHIPRELDPRSPRPFAELCPNSQHVYALNGKNGEGVRNNTPHFITKGDGVSKRWLN